ncbi:Phosphorylated adapter RNA export protein [Dirofilaria immitis]
MYCIMRNMYRVNKSYDESSSDDEGPSLCKEQKLDNTDDTMKSCRAGSKAAQMWTDLLAEQSLSETFSGKVGVYRGENDMVERGVESYVLPDVRFCNDQEMRHQLDHEVLPAADDSEPFDFIADEEKINNFPDRDEKYSCRNGGSSRSHKRHRSINFTNQRHTAELWKHSGSTSLSNSRNSRKRKWNNCNLNKRSRHRIAKNVNNMNNASNCRRDNRIPNSVLNGDYSLETLMTTEFPQDINISELAELIVEALGERNEKFLRSVILEIGEEKALKLFEATREIEAAGGMMIVDGTRRRTPGGVFMTLFKTDPDILPVLKEKVCNMQKAAAREIRTAKRRGKKETAVTFDARLKKVDMLQELSTASEVLLEKQSVKENPI